jgi:uncharacterized protein YdiU (UPF0061 family)
VAPAEALRQALAGYDAAFHEAAADRLLARLGLRARNADEDADLLRTTIGCLHASGVGVDRFFFDWYAGVASTARALGGPAAGCYTGPAFEAFRHRLAAYEPLAPERLRLPYFQGSEPCSLLYDEIETIWAAIDQRDDWGPFEAKLAAIDELRSANPELAARGQRP